MLKRLHKLVLRYAHAFHAVEHATHLTYFGLVFMHGPYHWAAGALLLLGVLAVVLRLGLDEVE